VCIIPIITTPIVIAAAVGTIASIIIASRISPKAHRGDMPKAELLGDQFGLVFYSKISMPPIYGSKTSGM
jgi:hypothetical protein